MPLINNVNELNERISIVELKIIRDSTGSKKAKEEIILFECWAQVRTARLRDYYVKDIVPDIQKQISFVIRYNPQMLLKDDMKLKWNGRIYNIHAVNYDYRDKEWTTLIASEMDKK
ncbi:MAG: phage head closure protein [Vagococcus sp.]